MAEEYYWAALAAHLLFGLANGNKRHRMDRQADLTSTAQAHYLCYYEPALLEDLLATLTPLLRRPQCT